MQPFPLLAFLVVAGSAFSHGATALFLGNEYQAQAGSNAGTIRGGDPAADPAFAAFLGTAELTSADLLLASDCDSSSPGVYATWGSLALEEFAVSLGATTATMDIVGWGSSGLTTPSGSAALNWGYNNGTALQSGSPRPGFASGSGSQYGIFTSGGSGSDGIRNAVRFTFSNPVSAFGVFGGDLETGGPGSPLGFLFVTFTDNTTETIDYAPDSSLFPNATFNGSGNNTSETYGNETTRFVGISDNTRLISSVVFVVGDDDLNDNGDNEQLSFIAPMTFTRVTAAGDCENHVPTAVPEPSALILAALACLTALSCRRR